MFDFVVLVKTWASSNSLVDALFDKPEVQGQLMTDTFGHFDARIQEGTVSDFNRWLEQSRPECINLGQIGHKPRSVSPKVHIVREIPERPHQLVDPISVQKSM